MEVKMEYMYSAMLLHKLGKTITEENVKKVLEAAGAKPDQNKIKALIVALDGVDIDKVIKEAAMPVAAPIAKPEEKREVKKEEKKEAEAAAGLGALFG